jgi:pimeloyl-ACP methyl ester carboxylesterase
MIMLNRRLLLGLLSAAVMAPTAPSQQLGNVVLKRARTGIMEIAYEESGPEAGFPVLLMHGFPYDPRCYDEVVPPLVAAGYRAIVPYLRGCGATRFLAVETRDQASRRRQAAISSTSWTRSTCRGQRLLASTGADGPRASSRRCGRNASVAPC